jgi:dolichyl-phosphate beta-glucosyltransferase
MVGLSSVPVPAPSPRLSLVFPAYREGQRLAETVAAARAFLEQHVPDWEIVLAVDGGGDTLAIAEAEAVRDERVSVVATVERRGKGRAVREAMARARGQAAGFMDADGKVPFDEITPALAALDQGFDLVVGSRRAAGARVETPRPLHRRWGSRGFQAALWLLLPALRGVPDTQCGFKFFRREVAQDLFARQRVDGYMFDVELLLLARRAGYRIKQIGLRWRDDGDSRLDLVSGNWRNLIDLLRIAAGRNVRLAGAGVNPAPEPRGLRPGVMGPPSRPAPPPNPGSSR